MGFRALFEDCHGVKHILSVRDRKEFHRLARHFLFVNKVKEQDFLAHFHAARKKAFGDSRELLELNIFF